MDELTPRQQAVLDFIATKIEAEGMPPTLAEIAAAFGFNQTRGAHKHLLALAAKGRLTLLPGKARGIRLPSSTRSRPLTGILPSAAPGHPAHRSDSLELPVLG